ncbi:unnamed protein product [Ilex paraguariensis]|uniref:Uncharacterized protein n=1 Tax=Ilex paraguariensis TaxID=185542 RepID=A0ABC8UXC1_9AQUA
MSVKKVMSSEDEVVTERDGGSILWPVKGTLVSMVMDESEEVEKRRVVGLIVVRDFRRLELLRVKAISVVGLLDR